MSLTPDDDKFDVFRYSMAELVKQQYKSFNEAGYVSTLAGFPVVVSDKLEEGDSIMSNSVCAGDVIRFVSGDSLDGNVERSKPFPEKIIVNGKVTTVIWKDGQKTTVRCMEGNAFSEYDAIVQAYFKREMGTTKNREKYMKAALKRVVRQEPKEKKTKKKSK